MTKLIIIRDIIAALIVAAALALVSTQIEACETKFKWVCDSQGKCEWITVCE